MPQLNVLSRPILIACCTYLLTLGATFNGIFIPEVSALTLPLLGLLVIVWLVLHLRGYTRGRWRWYHTPLDIAMILWGAAIGIALLANLEDWRRIVIGIWYVAVYVVGWYLLSDLLANRHLKRGMLVDAVLVVGLLLLLPGYAQVITAYLNGDRYSGLFGLVRPVSLIGNPNSLAAILIVMIGLAAGRLVAARRTGRLIYGLYLLATLLLLLLTFSRGGWLGGAAALLIPFGLWLAATGNFTLARLRESFARLNRVYQAGLILAAVVGIVIVIALGGVFIASFSEGGRSADLRTYIWDAALTLFAEKPLTGHGLYTFGKGLQRLASMPPLTPHSHAHSFPLHVMAELGLPGVVALLVSLGAALWIMRQNWRNDSLTAAERGTLIGGIAASIGFGVHHLFDTPLMMPSIAVIGLLALLVATAPVVPVPIAARWRQIAQSVVIVVTAAVLVVTGWWSSRIYAQYIRIVQDGLKSEQYADTARNLQTVIDADPALMIYHWQQGMLYGLDAAVTGSLDSAEQGADAFGRALRIEPQNAVLAANLAALRWQSGHVLDALGIFAQAAANAPDSWQLALVWARHADAAGDLFITTACDAYLQAVEREPQVILHPDLVDIPDRCHWSQPLKVTLDPPGMVASRYFAGDDAGALAAWDQAPIRTTQGYVLRALILLHTGDREAALQALAQADALVSAEDPLTGAWLLYGQAALSGTGYEAVTTALTPALTGADYSTGVNVARAQFMREVIARQFLPQVGYDTADPILLRLMAEHPN